ncbi:EAL domain-containing protein [Vibrio maerlii]|uniref:EAL domain-containing protein n=1 Tax=Vibrio maerlii TaxID=2231648 RepID=UPI000E3C0809|nr:EAL domain-containing protein [Vibrio maerlii]
MKPISESIYSKISRSQYLIGLCNVFIKLLPISVICALLLLISNALSWLGFFQYSAHVNAATSLTSQLFPILLIAFYSQAIAAIQHQNKEGITISSLVSYFLICHQWGMMTAEVIVPPNTFLAICLPLVVSRVLQVFSSRYAAADTNLPSVVDKSIRLVTLCCAAIATVLVASTLLLNVSSSWVDWENLMPNLDPNSLVDGLFYELVRNLLWSVGINGHVIFSTYKSEIYELTAQSIQAYQTFGTDIPIFTSNFFDFYAGMGGAGNTLSLVLCMLFLSKTSTYRKLGMTVLLLSVFNINEPVIYGLPIMFNPIMIIPFIITPVVGLILAYLATYFGLVPPISELMSWLTPPVISGYIGTGNSIAGGALQVIILIVGMAIYLPFFRRMESLSGDSVVLPKIKSEQFFYQQGLSEFSRNNSVLSQLDAKVNSQKVVSNLQNSGDFILFYQPQYDVTKSKVVSMEVLIRHKGHDGKITPPHFIEHFSNLGMMAELDLWVVKQALEESAQFASNPDFKVSINISPDTFLIPNFTQILLDLVSVSQLDATQVELEITEDLLIKDEALTFGVLSQLRAKGISIALDDFGSGYSSIGYLSKFEFDKVKIDRSLVVNSKTEKGRNLLKLTCEIAAMSGSKVIVEGVESEEEVSLVKSLDVSLIQGYYYYKPMPLSYIDELDLFTHRKAS